MVEPGATEQLETFQKGWGYEQGMSFVIYRDLPARYEAGERAGLVVEGGVVLRARQGLTTAD